VGIAGVVAIVTQHAILVRADHDRAPGVERRTGNVTLFERLIVYVNLALFHLNLLARQADDAFDEIAVRGAGVLEYYDVAAIGLVPEINKLVDDKVLAGVQGRLHAVAVDMKVLYDGAD
jgi:hypothetical protein